MQLRFTLLAATPLALCSACDEVVQDEGRASAESAESVPGALSNTGGPSSGFYVSRSLGSGGATLALLDDGQRLDWLLEIGSRWYGGRASYAHGEAYFYAGDNCDLVATWPWHRSHVDLRPQAIPGGDPRCPFEQTTRFHRRPGRPELEGTWRPESADAAAGDLVRVFASEKAVMGYFGTPGRPFLQQLTASGGREEFVPFPEERPCTVTFGFDPSNATLTAEWLSTSSPGCSPSLSGFRKVYRKQSPP